jgi:hypothetical protein
VDLVLCSDSVRLYKSRPEHTHRRITDSGVQVKIEWEVWHFLRMYARKCMSQRRLDETDVSVVEREETPYQLMRRSTQLYLTESSLSNSISILELFGVQRLNPPFITGFTKPMDRPN